MSGKKYIGSFLVGLVAVFCIFHNGANAASSTQVIQKISIAPTAVNKIVQAGSQLTGAFDVTNQGNNTFTFRVYAAPYSVKNYDYTPDFSPIPGKPNASSWITFSLSQALLGPNQSKEIGYTVTIPKNTLPGDYYAVAFAESKLQSSQGNSSGINLYQRVGYIYYLTVAGPAKESGKVSGWQVGFLQQKPINSTLFIEDSGSTHYTSTININVRDIFGSVKYSYNSQKIILPQTIRKVGITWQDSPSLALYKINGTATVLGQTQKLPTKYILVISKNVRITIISVVVVVILLIVIRYSLLKRAKKSKIFKAEDRK